MAAEAKADSDGWYCVGPGYVAYELQTSMGVTAHELRVVRVGGGRISGPSVVPLDAFQVHGMACAEKTITIWGFDTAYGVDVTGSPPRVARLENAVPTDAPAKNLGHWSQAGVAEIASADPDYRYQVVITKAETWQGNAAGGMIERFTQTQIWQRARDAGGQVTAVEPLFHGVFEETID